MLSDEELKLKGYEALREKLNLVDVERFISIIQREKFDYTEWSQTLFEGMSIEEISHKAMEHWKRKYGTEAHIPKGD